MPVSISPEPSSLENAAQTPAWVAAETFAKVLTASTPWLDFTRQLQQSLMHLEEPLVSQQSFLQTTRGKQLRPLLVFACCSLLASPDEQTMKAALAAELIHIASLVHDDIIDNSPTRRGQPTLNHLKGPYISVLMGDALFAEAFKILANQQMTVVLGYYIQAIQDMCKGEMQQDQQKFSATRSIPEYLEQISLKTGALISACCQAGVQAAQGSASQLLAAASFGTHLGIAFQIADDIMDCTGNEQQLGKPPGNDLAEGTLTLPFLLLLKDPLYGPWFQDLLSRRAFTPTVPPAPSIASVPPAASRQSPASSASTASTSPTAIYQVLQAITASGVLFQAKQQALYYAAQAQNDLLAFPDTPARQFLIHQVDKIFSPLSL